MKRRTQRGIGVTVATMMLLALTAGSAVADPKTGQHFGPISVDCGDHGSYTVVVPGRAQFGVGLDLDSTTVGVVLGLRNQSFTYTDPDGIVYPPEVDPTEYLKGSGKQKGVWCQYSFDIDSGNGLENFSGSGEVKLHLTPGK